MSLRKPLPQATKRKEWQIEENGTTIPYYVDEEHQKILGNLLPHDKITGEFPFDTYTRGTLLPFVFICRQMGYSGLDKEGYDLLVKLITKQKLFEEVRWIGQVSLDSLAEIPSKSPNLLISRNSCGREIYFPTAYYVMGNKQNDRPNTTAN